MNNAAAIKIIPLNFIIISLFSANILSCLIALAKRAQSIMIIHSPKAKLNKYAIACNMLFDKLATAITDAKIGVEQGEDESAKTIPIINGYINNPPFVF